MFTKWADLFFKNIVLRLFFAIFILIGAAYIFLIFTAPLSLERLQLLISIDAVAATLTGLLLYASYASQNEDRKRVYYQCGERFLHSFIFLFGAAFLRGCTLMLDDFSWYADWRVFILNILRIITLFFFLYGFVSFYQGLKKILVFILTLDKQ